MATNEKQRKGVMYVYKLDTGNRTTESHPYPPTPPPSTTATTKKAISRRWGVLRRSKTYRENELNPHHHQQQQHNYDKEDRKEMVQESARKSVSAIEGGRKSVSVIEDIMKSVSVIEEGRKAVEDGRKSVSVIEEGRKTAPWMEKAGTGWRRSVGNRAEMIMMNVGPVAELLQVRVLVTDMPGFMQVHAFRCARQTFDSLEKFSAKQIALNLKKEFDKVYGPAWHCIVGSSFGSFVTHATGGFLYFSMEKLYILVFKTKVKKTVN